METLRDGSWKWTLPSRPQSTLSLHLSSFICSFSTYSRMCTLSYLQAKGQGDRSSGCLPLEVAIRRGRWTALHSSRDVLHTGGPALLDILTEPWLEDDFADPAVGKLPAWRGCRAKASTDTSSPVDSENLALTGRRT